MINMEAIATSVQMIQNRKAPVTFCTWDSQVKGTTKSTRKRKRNHINHMIELFFTAPWLSMPSMLNPPWKFAKSVLIGRKTESRLKGNET
jgi:hypothetical protein